MKLQPVAVTDHPDHWVRVARSLVAQSPVEVSLEDVNGYDVEMTVVALPMQDERPGRFVVERICVRRQPEGASVTGEALRSIPVHRLAVQQASQLVMRVEIAENHMTLENPDFSDEAVERARLEGPVPKTLQLVAFIYELAAVVGRPPTNAVAEQFKIPRSTAGRWVTLARERGHLAPVGEET